MHQRNELIRDEDRLAIAMAGALRADLLQLGSLRRGVPWSAASRDLNATCLSWEPGHRIEAHRTMDRDVLVIGIDGIGTVYVEGVAHAVTAGTIVLVPAGAERTIEAGASGFVYVSVHTRRERPLEVVDLTSSRDGSP